MSIHHRQHFSDRFALRYILSTDSEFFPRFSRCHSDGDRRTSRWSIIGEGYCDHRSRDHDCITLQALWISNTVTDENIKRYMFEGILKDYVLYVATDRPVP